MNPSTASPLHPPARPRAGRRLLWLASALLLCGACSSMEGSLSSPAAVAEQSLAAEPSGGLDLGADGSYDFESGAAEGDLLTREHLAASPSSPGSFADETRASFAPAKDKTKGKGKGKAKKPKDAEAEDTKAEPEEAGGDDDQTPDHGREIIYTANMYVSVYDLAHSMEKVEALPEKYGGWVHMRTTDTVVLRLPAPALKPAMAEIGEQGNVESRNLQAQDVTAEYVDLEARITVLRETQTQLLELLGKAKTVEEALHVRNALDNVTMELETALGRMRQLSDMIGFSTLTVVLVQRGPQDPIPTSNDPFRWVDQLGVEATEWR